MFQKVRTLIFRRCAFGINMHVKHFKQSISPKEFRTDKTHNFGSLYLGNQAFSDICLYEFFIVLEYTPLYVFNFLPVPFITSTNI